MATQISATEASKKFGNFINTALQWPVAITKNNKTVLVTITPKYLEDLIDGALADQAMTEGVASAHDVAKLYQKLDDYAAQNRL